MPQIIEQHNPSFLLMPHNNNRTGWRPISLPIILVEPDRRNRLGTPLDNSAVVSARIIIEDTPRKNRVAGHDHVGLLVPDTELYTHTISAQEMNSKRIDPSLQTFYAAEGGQITYEEAEVGDWMELTTLSGVKDQITYYPSANYYDLSDIQIETAQLPSGYYFLSYQVDYHARTVSRGQLLCIDPSAVITAVRRFRFNHPGQLLEEFIRLMPRHARLAARPEDDDHIAFLRPFVDAMQDIYDEQDLLQTLNWVDHTSPEFVPYLAHLLGLDIPFFPQSVDRLRRTMLSNVVRLQQLKGSRRAILELFELFGYTISLINLYYSADGTHFVRPGTPQLAAHAAEQIDIVPRVQFEPVLAGYDISGFGDLVIPLLYRPSLSGIKDGVNVVSEGGEITLDFYYVTKGSNAEAELQALTAEIDLDPDGWGNDNEAPLIVSDGILGYSKLQVSSDDKVSETATAGVLPPVIRSGIRIDRKQNLLRVIFNGALQFQQPNPLEPGIGPGSAVYGFARYIRQEFLVPTPLQNLRSNRFDLLLRNRDGEQVSPELVEFLVDFLFQIKAFHSILNVIIYSHDLREAYAVTDLGVGGDFEQRYDIDAGRLQVPPAIIPRLPTEGDCDRLPVDLGYKQEDILYQQRVLAALEDEADAWKHLGERDTTGKDTLRIAPAQPETETDCRFSLQGQARVLTDNAVTQLESQDLAPTPNANALRGVLDNAEESPIRPSSLGSSARPTANVKNTGFFGNFEWQYGSEREQICSLDGTTDYYYRGRVKDSLLLMQVADLAETYVPSPCGLAMGTGVYFLLPATPVGTTPAHQTRYDNFLGRLYRAYTTDDFKLCYTDRPTLTSNGIDALTRPSLNITLPTMGIPGTRFPTMSKLAEDFTHTEWRAHPWDDTYSKPCGNPCHALPDYLNAQLSENTDGDQTLVFDDLPYFIEGNGLESDIPNMSGQDLGTGIDPELVIHSIYTSNSEGHPAITLEGMCSAAGTGPFGNVSPVDKPRYGSAASCGTGYVDYIDGYPCSSGWMAASDPDLDRDGLYSDIFEAMELPSQTWPTSFLFYLGDGFDIGVQGFRLGCGCLVSECGGTSGTVGTPPVCPPEFYRNTDQSLYFGGDQLGTDIYLIADEITSCGSYTMDGAIPSMFELLATPATG